PERRRTGRLSRRVLLRRRHVAAGRRVAAGTRAGGARARDSAHLRTAGHHQRGSDAPGFEGWIRTGKCTLAASPGRIFGPCRIDRLLGRGGMGEVYAADELATGRRVALKVLTRSPLTSVDRERFLREGRLAASLSHPNLVYIFGSAEIDGIPFI